MNESFKKKRAEKRTNYLKKLSLFCMIIDVFTYLSFEIIEFRFANNKINELLCFIPKVKNE